MADKLEISETSVRNWETGRTEPTMTPQKYQELLGVLKCTPEELAVASKTSIDCRQKRKPGRPKKLINTNVSNVLVTVAEQTMRNETSPQQSGIGDLC